MKRGFTLLETAVVISILLLLGALLLPVYTKAKRAAKITRSISNMRQLHQAVIIYMGSETSLQPGMGLPPGPVHLKNAHDLPDGLFHTGGSPIGGIAGQDVYAFMWPRPGDSNLDPWLKHVAETDNNPILIVDGTHNPVFEGDFPPPFETRQGIGIYIDGHVDKRKSNGSLNRYEVWE